MPESGGDILPTHHTCRMPIRIWLPTLLVASLTFVLAKGQGPIPSANGPTREVLPCGPALLLPTDTTLPRKLQGARDYVRSASWSEAIRLLQDLLESPEDVFLLMNPGTPGERDVPRWISARAEAEQLLATLPRAGIEVYESTIGPRARARLEAAKGDPVLVAEVARHFLHTRAGAEAAARLGSLHFDRGRFALAAACFDRCLSSVAGRSDRMSLALALLAHRAAGHEQKTAALGKRLHDETAGEIRIGQDFVPIGDLEKAYRRSADAGPVADWPLLGGTAERSAWVAAERFVPEPRWQRSTAQEATTRAWLAEALRLRDGDGRDPYRASDGQPPPLPAAAPIAVGGKVIYRNHGGVAAVDVETGAILWQAPFVWGLDAIVHEPSWHAHINAWVESYLNTHPYALLDNSVLGSISSDGLRVFAIEDLPIPPYPANYASFASRTSLGGEFPTAPELSDALHHNRLVALDLASGRALWQAGGRGRAGGDAAFLRGAYFLGPPLPLAGRLYVPVQKGFDLTLACLDPADGRLVWHQTLASYKGSLAREGGRRLRAIHLAHGDGLLICPTHAGGIIAFDLAAHRLAWAHAYREEPPFQPVDPFARGRRGPAFRTVFVTEPPNLRPEWRTSAPVMAARSVLLAPTDSTDLLCLDLESGRSNWKLGRGENLLPSDLYLAGVQSGRAIVVGQKGVTAVDVTEGRRLWTCETNLPMGHGAIGSNVYSLVTRGENHKAEVIGIDLVRGTVVTRVPLPGREAAGNLLFHRGALLSLGALNLTAFGPSVDEEDR